MFALVDGNSFYASCEQVFQPQLRGKPLVVLSNNDGAAIARTAEAKALGVRMGQPAHELRHLVRQHGLHMRSANFALYGDMSARMVSILRDAVPRIEVYSIDESFLDLSGIRNRLEFAHKLRERVHRWTGIPNCVGIGPTKTLAKVANRMAKKGAGVIDLSDPAIRNAAMEDFPAAELWGVGQRWAAKLASMGITTAAQLRDSPPDLILERFGVVLHRSQRELQGLPCHTLEEIEPDRQQIMVSRSFGGRVEDHQAIAEALATFAVSACEKLRRREMVASALWVFTHTDPFRPEISQHHPSRTAMLPAPTNDTRVVLTALRSMLRGMLRDGYAYKKAGVCLMGLHRPTELQGDLFSPSTIGDAALMSTLDQINRKFGRGTAGLGASGWQNAPAWAMRQRQLSPHYTTRICDLPRASC